MKTKIRDPESLSQDRNSGSDQDSIDSV